MVFLEGSGVPVIYIGRAVPKGECALPVTCFKFYVKMT
jgi:hypothetical protein